MPLQPSTERAAALLPPDSSPLAREMAPGLKSLLVQAVSVLLWLMLGMPVLERIEVSLLPLQHALCIGIIAAGLGWAWQLPRWWLPINILFVPGLVTMNGLGLEPYWYLAIFALLLLVYWSVARTRVPLYLSSHKAWEAVAERLPASAVVADLGSGLGGLLHFLAQQRPDGRYVGMEIAPLPFLLSWLRMRLGSGCYEVRWASLWHVDLQPFDVVYAYLSPVPMADLWRKVQQEMRPGTLFISNTFQVPGVEPNEMVPLDDLHQSRLYIYRLSDVPVI
ncbi:MAG: class I SAM-dependent methyltransferase [Gammaproteobacteria bacterium]|nr:class I SAM-dependent methyltransferase [Gammaproteobacteria bacterium]MBU1733398.1 class I SAM-dependent methyltransferase [Gammaproteobacteria bacterium]MBU1891815.1 class I SAM-dependent methyltransferase [Gammaproteobacteria bacterium]